MGGVFFLEIATFLSLGLGGKLGFFGVKEAVQEAGEWMETKSDWRSSGEQRYVKIRVEVASDYVIAKPDLRSLLSNIGQNQVVVYVVVYVAVISDSAMTKSDFRSLSIWAVAIPDSAAAKPDWRNYKEGHGWVSMWVVVMMLG